MKAPAVVDDATRVAAVQRLGLIHQPPAPDLDGLTRLAAFVTGSPVAVVNLIDADTQWQISASGVQPGAYPREDSLCQHTVAEGRTIHVSDARADVRFCDSPFVTGELDTVGMYCGIPLRDADDAVLGTLCVTDTEVRELSAAQLTALADLAAQVEQLFELRRQHARLLSLLAEVDHLAAHDPLTGLANRRTLHDRVEHAFARSRRTGIPPVLFVCDLDGFKAVNDTFGHDVGDAVLIEASRRLCAQVRPNDTVARLGGDEFVVLCEDLPHENISLVAARIRSVCHEPMAAGAHTVRVGISVGLAIAEAESDVSALLARADRRMYADKAARRAS